MKRVVHRVHVDDTECNSGRGQKKKRRKFLAQLSADIFAFWPCSRRAFTVIVLTVPCPCYYRPYLRLAVSFLPRHHVPRTRVSYLADSTDLSSSNTAPSFSFNLAVEKSVDSPLLFLFSFFFSWYSHQLPFHLFPRF